MPAWIDGLRIRLYLPFMNRLYADETVRAAGQTASCGWSINSTNGNGVGRDEDAALIAWLLAGIPLVGALASLPLPVEPGSG